MIKHLAACPGLPFDPRAAPTQRRRLRANRQFHWWQWDSRLFDLGQPLEKLSAAKGSIWLVGSSIIKTAKVSHNCRGNCQPLTLTTGKALGTQNSAVQSAPFAWLLQPVWISPSAIPDWIKSKGDFIGSRVPPTRLVGQLVLLYNSIHGIINRPIVGHSLAKHVPVALNLSEHHLGMTCQLYGTKSLPGGPPIINHLAVWTSALIWRSLVAQYRITGGQIYNYNPFIFVHIFHPINKIANQVGQCAARPRQSDTRALGGFWQSSLRYQNLSVGERSTAHRLIKGLNHQWN